MKTLISNFTKSQTKKNRGAIPVSRVAFCLTLWGE